jgi:hypothetical protein
MTTSASRGQCNALASLVVAAILWPGIARAGSARDYLNAPVDTWLLTLNASYTTSVTPEDGTDTIPGVRSNVFAQSVVLTRVMDFLGRTGGLSIVLPYAWIETSAGLFRASTNGVSDVGFLFQMNIFGGPALTREEFRFFVPQTFSSFHLLVTTPLGTYEPTSPINPSANRWMISPTINFSYTPDQGWSWIETYVAGRFFGNNNNFLVNGAQTLSQKPLLRLEEHVSRNLTMRCGCRSTPITISAEKRTSTGSSRTTWRTPCSSAQEWGFVYGKAPISW